MGQLTGKKVHSQIENFLFFISRVKAAPVLNRIIVKERLLRVSILLQTLN